jgi:hypothetical protein
VIDARTTAILQELVRRQSRSLLQYVGDAFPWTTREEQAAPAELQKIVEEERQGAADAVALLLRRHQMPPYLGSYPMDFTTINYVSLDHLLPLLVDDERRAIAGLERDVAAVSDPEARGLVQAILDKKRAHLACLTALRRSALGVTPCPT